MGGVVGCGDKDQFKQVQHYYREQLLLCFFMKGELIVGGVVLSMCTIHFTGQWLVATCFYTLSFLVIIFSHSKHDKWVISIVHKNIQHTYTK